MKQNPKETDLLQHLMEMVNKLNHEVSELCLLARIAIESEDPELIRWAERRILQIEEHNRRFEEQLEDM